MQESKLYLVSTHLNLVRVWSTLRHTCQCNVATAAVLYVRQGRAVIRSQLRNWVSDWTKLWLDKTVTGQTGRSWTNVTKQISHCGLDLEKSVGIFYSQCIFVIFVTQIWKPSWHLVCPHAYCGQPCLTHTFFGLPVNEGPFAPLVLLALLVWSCWHCWTPRGGKWVGNIKSCENIVGTACCTGKILYSWI